MHGAVGLDGERSCRRCGRGGWGGRRRSGFFGGEQTIAGVGGREVAVERDAVEGGGGQGRVAQPRAVNVNPVGTAVDQADPHGLVGVVAGDVVRVAADLADGERGAGRDEFLQLRRDGGGQKRTPGARVGRGEGGLGIGADEGGERGAAVLGEGHTFGEQSIALGGWGGEVALGPGEQGGGFGVGVRGEGRRARGDGESGREGDVGFFLHRFGDRSACRRGERPEGVRAGVGPERDED